MLACASTPLQPDSSQSRSIIITAVRQSLAMVPPGLGIICAHVGGLLLTDTTYHPGAGPCGKIAGYEPGSDVTQHNRLDLDQNEMEGFLGKTPPDFTKAKAIYEQGAHSGAYARLTVIALPADLAKSAAVVQAVRGHSKHLRLRF
jgi:hypothetical protein